MLPAASVSDESHPASIACCRSLAARKAWRLDTGVAAFPMSWPDVLPPPTAGSESEAPPAAAGGDAGRELAAAELAPGDGRATAASLALPEACWCALAESLVAPPADVPGATMASGDAAESFACDGSGEPGATTPGVSPSSPGLAGTSEPPVVSRDRIGERSIRLREGWLWRVVSRPAPRADDFFCFLSTRCMAYPMAELARSWRKRELARFVHGNTTTYLAKKIHHVGIRYTR